MTIRNLIFRYLLFAIPLCLIANCMRSDPSPPLGEQTNALEATSGAGGMSDAEAAGAADQVDAGVPVCVPDETFTYQCNPDDPNTRLRYDSCGISNAIFACPYGCADGDCLACVPSSIVSYECVVGKPQRMSRDSCGKPLAVFACPYGCKEGACLPCVPDGTFTERCNPTNTKTRLRFNSCGKAIAIFSCPLGCANDACIMPPPPSGEPR